MKNNSQTYIIFMLMIIAVDFILVNGLLYLMTEYHPWFARWTPGKVRILILLSNAGLMIAEVLNPPIIQKRVISSGDAIKRVLQLSLILKLQRPSTSLPTKSRRLWQASLACVRTQASSFRIRIRISSMRT